MRKAVNQILPLKSSRILATSLSARSKLAIDEFYITLDDPHKTYKPGEEVSGQIILILKKNLVNIIVNLSLIGVIKANSTSPLRSVKKQYLFNHKIVLYGDSQNNENALTKGEHRFPFIVKLPKKNIYTSISFERGQIKYNLKCDLLDKALDDTPVLRCEKSISIIKPINLALLPEPQPKLLSFKNNRKNLQKTISSTSSINSIDSLETNSTTDDDIKIKLLLNSTGYLRGESISVKLNVKHFKRISNMNGIIVTLIRICRLDLGEEHEIQSYRKDLSQSIVPLITDPKGLASEVSTALRIPVDCFPTIVSSLVSFQYYIEVLVNLSNSKIQIHNPNNEIVDDEVIQSETMNFLYNVDRLKKMKNVLTITSEIVLGTERKPISTLKKRIKSKNSSPVPVSSPHTPSTSSESPVDTNSSALTSPMIVPSVLPIPATNNMRYASSISGLPQVDEKQLLKLREDALLPSEPPIVNYENRAGGNLPDYQQVTEAQQDLPMTFHPSPLTDINMTSPTTPLDGNFPTGLNDMDHALVKNGQRRSEVDSDVVQRSNSLRHLHLSGHQSNIEGAQQIQRVGIMAEEGSSTRMSTSCSAGAENSRSFNDFLNNDDELEYVSTPAYSEMAVGNSNVRNKNIDSFSVDHGNMNGDGDNNETGNDENNNDKKHKLLKIKKLPTDCATNDREQDGGINVGSFESAKTITGGL